MLRELGTRIQTQRLELGWSQETLAHKVGIHPTYVSTVENGQRNVGIVNVVKIAAALKLDPADLVAALRA